MNLHVSKMHMLYQFHITRKDSVSQGMFCRASAVQIKEMKI